MRWYDVQQGSEEWMQLRCGKATASNFCTIMTNDGQEFGDPAKRYALQIAIERIRGVKAEVGFTNDHTKRGHEQEPIARSMYEDENFIDVTNGGFFDHVLYGDSPDGLVGNDGVIEIKSVIAPTHYSTLKRGSFDPAYTWQLAGHLDCTGRDWVDFVSYCSEFPEDKQLLVFRSYRADFLDKIDRLQKRRKEFLVLVEEIIAELLGINKQVEEIKQEYMTEEAPKLLINELSYNGF